MSLPLICQKRITNWERKTGFIFSGHYEKCNPFIQQSVNYLCGHQVELMGLWNLLYQSLGSAYKAKIWISHHHWIFTWIPQLLILKRKTTSFMVICWEERKKKFNVIFYLEYKFHIPLCFISTSSRTMIWIKMFSMYFLM